jgi:hypothetical protein
MLTVLLFVLCAVVYHHYPNHNISSDTLAAVRVFATEGLRIDVINDAVTNKIWWTGDPCLALMNVRALAPRWRCLVVMIWIVYDTLQATAPPESEVVGRLLKTWLFYRSAIFYREVRGTCPHDALTVAEAIYPGAHWNPAVCARNTSPLIACAYVRSCVCSDRFVQYARGHLMIHEWYAHDHTKRGCDKSGFVEFSSGALVCTRHIRAGFSTFVLDEGGPHRIGVTVAAPEFLEFLSDALTRDLVSRPADEIDPMEEARLLEEVKMRNFVFAG